MSTDQDSGGFLPPLTTVFTTQLHRQPPSPPTGFITLPLPQPQPSPTSPKTTSNNINSCTTQESELTAAIDRAIIKIQHAVASATKPTTVDTNNSIRRTKSDSTCQEHPTRRNPPRRTGSGTVTQRATRRRKVWPPASSRNTVPESSNREEGPKVKRLRKMEEVVTEIEQRFRDLRRESEDEDELENVGVDNPSKAILETKEGGEECVGFKRLNEDEEECVGFNRLDDGSLRIKMRCSCHKRFEILHNHIGCFYRLI